MSTRGIALLLLTVLLASGCDRQAKPEPRPDMSKVFMQVEDCMRMGDTNGALTVLTTAMADKTYSMERGWLYGYSLNILLMADRLDEAKAKYMDTIGKDEELTRVGFGVMYGGLAQKGDSAALEAWLRQMMAAPLPKDMLAQTYAWSMGLFCSQDKLDKAIELIPACIKTFDVGTHCGILEGMVAGQISAAKYDQAGILLDAIEKAGGSSPELKQLVAIDRGDILFMRGNWKDGEQHFMNVAPGLKDGDQAGWFSRVTGRCIGQQQLDLADRLCEVLLKGPKDKSGSRNAAATRWIDVAKARKVTAMMPARLDALLGMEIPASVVFPMYRNDFYTVMGEGKKDDVAAMLVVGDKLEKLLAKDDEKNQIRTLALDGAFVVEDYARSLKILEGGIPDRDKKWHAMAISKAKAHLALKAGNPKEAVEYFRQFMASVATWEKPEQDPITGAFYSKEMCLANNAKRIGDIWGKAGDAKAAADAYAEAKQYYEKALKDVKDDSPEAEIIKTGMAELAKATAP